MLDSFHRDDRGSSEGVSWMLAFGLSSFVALTLIGGGSAIFDTVIEDTQEEQLEVLGEQIGSSIETVDRDARSTGASGEVREFLPLSDKIGGDEYTIHIRYNDTSDWGVIAFELTDGDEAIETRFYSNTTVQNATLDGGGIGVVRPDGETTIEVNNAN
jgi:hypothetical protein